MYLLAKFQIDCLTINMSEMYLAHKKHIQKATSRIFWCKNKSIKQVT